MGTMMTGRNGYEINHKLECQDKVADIIDE